MTPSLNRRSFLATSAALAAASSRPRFAVAQSPALKLSAASRTLDIDGKAANAYGLVNASGGSGLILDPGQHFSVDLTNDLDVETIIHWHGQIPPNAQDGVPGMPAPLLKPGEARSYDFAPKTGTHWMHSHVPLQEMALLAAPLIVRSDADAKADRQEVVMMLHDFSFRAPEDVLAEITGGSAGMAGMSGMDMGGMDIGKMDMGNMKGMSGMSGMATDLNDYGFDAYLTNDRTLSDPDVVNVEANGRVWLRVINGSAATACWIDTGALDARLVAVDRHDVQPLAGRRFGLAMGQRLDIEVQLAGTGAFPILALREGARERTSLILATAGSDMQRMALLAEEAAPAFDGDLAQESQLRAVISLPEASSARSEMLMLSGSMNPYLWTINGHSWVDHVPVTAKSGERLEITLHNMSMMGHPMHLHGHSFQVVDTGAGRFGGAMRDTVFVPSMGTVTVVLAAGEAANWMLHCHHMPHLA